METSFLVVVLTLLSSCCFCRMSSLELAPYPLPGRLHPSKHYVTVSGEESGGVFAQMMHFSHSKYITGCAAYSSTFYRCGPPNGNVQDYVALCTKNSVLPPENQYHITAVVSELQTNAATHVIDDLQYLRNDKVYVYCGLKNLDFRADQQLKIIALYEHYVSSAYSLYSRVQYRVDQELRVIDTSYPEAAVCPRTTEADGSVSPNCTNMSAPAEGLGFILGGYLPNYINPFYPYLHYTHLEPLRSFNQTEFTVGLDNPGLDEVGYFYVPRYCQLRSHAQRYNYGYHHSYSKPCLVHAYFHGCKQGREFVGTSHVLNSNYLEIAEKNYIIMLFPQALSSDANPEGCWDFVGFTGVLYATKSGPQVQAVWKMLERLLYLMPERTTDTYYRAAGRSGSSGGDSMKNKYQKPNYGKGYSNKYTSTSGGGCTSSTCGNKPGYF